MYFQWDIFVHPEWLIFEIERGWSIRHRQYLVLKTMDIEMKKPRSQMAGNIVQVINSFSYSRICFIYLILFHS